MYSVLTWTSVLSCIHLAIISDAKPTLCMSIVSNGFGLPFAGKCMNTGAVFIRSYNTNMCKSMKINKPNIYQPFEKCQIPHQNLLSQSIKDYQSVYENSDMNLLQL